MRRALSIMAAAVAVVLVSAMLAAGALAGGSVAVKSTTPWVFAGVEVTEGATYDVTARGFVQTAKIPYYHDPGVSKSASGPAGQPDGPCLPEYEDALNGQCTLEGANFGALVAMVFDPETWTPAADPFLIGADPSFVAPASGLLFLAVNDLNLTYYDNNGQFEVAVTAR